MFGVSSLRIFGVKIQTESVFCIASSFFVHGGAAPVYEAHALWHRHARRGDGHQGRAGLRRQHIAEHGVTWAIAAGMAALAGILLGPIYGVFIMLGSTIGRKGFAGAIMGGYGNMYGAIVGGILLGLIENADGQYLSSVYKDMIPTRCC